MTATTHYDKTSKRELVKVSNAETRHWSGGPSVYYVFAIVEALEPRAGA